MASEPDWAEIYSGRRNALRRAVGNGAILLLGHAQQPRNYGANPYPFRQNSHFLYYCGIAEPDFALLMFPEHDYDVLFSRPVDLDDIIWSGAGPTRVELARRAGIETVEDLSRIGSYLAKAQTQGLKVHYLPPYQTSALMRMAELVEVETKDVVGGASGQLMLEVARQRSVKSDEEIAEIEDALAVTDKMHRAAMAEAKPGRTEYQVAGSIQGIALSHNRQQAYIPIVTVHGEVLHNNTYGNVLQTGKLLLNDSGAESPRFYASDITRTFPIGGRFSTIQAEIYQAVLDTQLGAIDLIRPGLTYKEVHLGAAKILADHLRSIGLMKGNAEDAVAAGAHALFLPHGIGHMMGLDVHDMEDLGDIVGYVRGQSRSRQFGLNALRLSRPLEDGFVLTVEPGIYFIPALIRRWQQERLTQDFICYDKLEPLLAFGGIRIEDNIVVTPAGARILGPGIPKTIAEVEAAMAS